MQLIIYTRPREAQLISTRDYQERYQLVITTVPEPAIFGF